MFLLDEGNEDVVEITEAIDAIDVVFGSVDEFVLAEIVFALLQLT
jgi:hypothetical protein